jgi:hypothetical protein
MKAAGTLYCAAMVALAVSAGYGAQSACFIEVLTTVGKASELPLERIAADNAMERVIEDGARSLIQPSASAQSGAARLDASENGFGASGSPHRPPRLVPGYRTSVTDSKYWT